MCGIIGYIGKKQASGVLLTGVENLEYRGYDSVGFATATNTSIDLRKDIGTVSQVNNSVSLGSMKGTRGIAHTRWATTGKVTKENSHPHESEDEEVYSVHNGIIENYQELRKELEGEGIELKSETDSEIIPQFVSFFLRQGHSFSEALVATLQKLQGSYALVLIHKETEELVFARKDSPLVLGIGADEFFLASDSPAFLEYTKKVVYIPNESYGFLRDDISLFDVETQKEKEYAIETISWDVDQAKKGEYDHFTAKEMNEQKETVLKAIQQPDNNLNAVIDTIKNAYGLFFVACGTSYYSAVSASYIFSHVAKKHVNVTIASEFRNYQEFLTDKTVLVAISQSGETADLLDAVAIAKKKGVKIISLVNVMGSSLMRASEHSLLLNAGPEISVVSTKAYTSQLSLLILLAYSLVGKQQEAKNLITLAAGEIDRVLTEEDNVISRIANHVYRKEHLFLIGRDLAYPSALEGALKIKEMSYIHAEGFAGGELKHGTMALIENDTPCICLSTADTKDLILSNASEIKARGGYIIGIGDENNDIFDEYIHVKELDSANPISMIIPLQLLAYYITLKKQLDPDKPRNLAKSVTVR